MADEQRTPTERLLRRKSEGVAGPQLSSHATQRERSLEGYFQAGNPPRWMERLAEIEHGIRRERARLEAVYRSLRGEPRFAERWRETLAGWRFPAELNELIAEHNEWYPVERRLPVDLRTRDYVLIHGRSYRRPVLDAAWALREFPASD